LSGQLLGFNKFISPYATASKKDMRTGVNYGSGCAGIRKESGRHLVYIYLDTLISISILV
jgi:hypothetical protein